MTNLFTIQLLIGDAIKRDDWIEASDLYSLKQKIVREGKQEIPKLDDLNEAKKIMNL